MKTRFVRTAFAVCLLGSAGAFALSGTVAPALAAEKPTSSIKVSPAAAKLLDAAKKQLDAGNAKDAMDILNQARALPGLTDGDNYEIAVMTGTAALRLNDHATAEQAFSTAADSPLLDDANKPIILGAVTLLSAEQKHFDKTIKYGQAALAASPTPDPRVLGAMATAYYYTNDYANAATFAQKAVDATPAGQAPNEGALQIIYLSQAKANQGDQAFATLGKLLTYYNEPTLWGTYIDAAMGSVRGIKDIEALYLYRLRLATKASSNGQDYMSAATLARSNGYPVEAEAYMNAGGIRPAGALADVPARAAKDRAAIASFEAAAAKSPNGELDVKLAETLYGYGRYADAAAAARRGLSKGKVDANEANMVLGQSLAMQGDNAGATAALKAIQGGDPGMSRAQLVWLTFAGRQYGGTASAAPAPAATH